MGRIDGVRGGEGMKDRRRGEEREYWREGAVSKPVQNISMDLHYPAYQRD
jgi:hypothetical protein